MTHFRICKSAAAILTGIFLILAGCATPLHKEFDHLQVGDDKSIVLEKLGSPTHSERVQGKDRWTYKYYRDGKEYQRLIELESSKLFSVGTESLVVDPNILKLESELENQKKSE